MGQVIAIILFSVFLLSLYYFKRFWIILFVLLSKCWFPVFTNILAIMLFAGTPQGKDIVTEVEFFKSGTRSFTSLLALWMWAYNCQKLARTTLELLGTYNLSGQRHLLARVLSSYVPGFLGFLPFLSAIFVFAYVQDTPDPVILSLLVMEAWFFLLFLLVRRKKAHEVGSFIISLKTLNLLSLYLFEFYSRLAKPVNKFFDSLFKKESHKIPELRIEKFNYKEHWRKNMNGEQSINWFSHTFIYLLVGIWPIYFSKFLGPIGLIFIALSFFCIIGILFAYLRKKSGLPLFQFLIILVLAFTIVNENNKSGIIQANKNDTREELNSHFEKWLKKRCSGKDTCQVTLVAAEGGGLRSAYWTYGVLRQLQLDNPEFYRHLYAISSVSGGSVGAALYCTEQFTGLSQHITGAPIINDDNLSPMISALLYRELVQSVIPVGIEQLDRSRVMNQIFETHWNHKYPGNPLWSKQFPDVWNLKPDLPALFINTIHVESGKNALFSTLRFDSSQVQSIDMMQLLQTHPTLSETVGLSSRFMIIQPAGKFEYPNGDTWGHLADGGYYDNSGVATIFQAYLNLRKQANKLIEKGIAAGVNFNIILISNVQQSYSDPNSSFMNEINIPARAMFNSWYSRVNSYQHIVRSTLPEINRNDRFFEIKLNRDSVLLPLGWLFSDKSKNEIIRQVGTLGNNEEYKRYHTSTH